MGVNRDSIEEGLILRSLLAKRMVCGIRIPVKWFVKVRDFIHCIKKNSIVIIDI
jgi:hypothetical protein